MPVVKSFKDLSPKKKKFAELYAKTGRVVDSVYNAGFKEGADRTDPKQRALADSLGRTMLRDPLVQQYVAANKPLPVNPNGFIDEPLIVEWKLSRMHGSVVATQMYCDPQANSAFNFLEEWIPTRIEFKDIVSHLSEWTTLNTSQCSHCRR